MKDSSPDYIVTSSKLFDAATAGCHETNRFPIRRTARFDLRPRVSTTFRSAASGRITTCSWVSSPRVRCY